MSLGELIIIAISLAMDAFAVAICKGLALRRFSLKKAIIVGLYFGIAQGVMPLIGYLLSVRFSTFIEAVDHFIAFGLLALIGANMIKEALSKEEGGCEGGCSVNTNDSVGFKTMIVLALATSIDALAVGVTFACLTIEISIVWAVVLIGAITFVLSLAGVGIGKIFGSKLKSKAEFLGGAVLILMGIKILIEHLMA